ncbi:protein YIPF5-like [Physella acuta]|uniref:protein YIPF5-like n=1 Tax=Physella acuta TaxID=109671 RepID=UPI0027DC5774|nr:protein YIPF5-like [Physella acuta]
MAGFNEEEGFYQTNFYDNQNYGFDPNAQAPFGQEPQFGQFDYNQGYTKGSTFGGDAGFGADQSSYTGSILTPNAMAYTDKTVGGDTEEDEPPLLEELGVNFDHIVQKVS